MDTYSLKEVRLMLKTNSLPRECRVRIWFWNNEANLLSGDLLKSGCVLLSEDDGLFSSTYVIKKKIENARPTINSRIKGDNFIDRSVALEDDDLIDIDHNEIIDEILEDMGSDTTDEYDTAFPRDLSTEGRTSESDVNIVTGDKEIGLNDLGVKVIDIIEDALSDDAPVIKELDTIKEIPTIDHEPSRPTSIPNYGESINTPDYGASSGSDSSSSSSSSSYGGSSSSDSSSDD